MDGADAPKPDGEDYATMLLWYEAQLSYLIAERELLKYETEEDNDFWNSIAGYYKSR